MKKLLCLMLTAVMLLSLCPVAQAARVGDVIGTVYNTDIVAYINNYAIPSYAANGTSVVVAEDLRNFGFDVAWNPYNKTLSITRNYAVYPNEMSVSKTGAPNTKFANLLYTDIVVYANGIQIPSYAINGYTMIPLESLTMFGSYNWVSEQRALKLWIDGLHVRGSMQPVGKHKLTEDEAEARIIAWMGGDTGTWVTDQSNILVCQGEYTVNGKQYYQFILKGFVYTHYSTLTFYVISTDGTEIFEGMCDRGYLNRF